MSFEHLVDMLQASKMNKITSSLSQKNTFVKTTSLTIIVTVNVKLLLAVALDSE